MPGWEYSTIYIISAQQWSLGWWTSRWYLIKCPLGMCAHMYILYLCYVAKCWAFSKMLHTQSWKYTTIRDVSVCCSVTISIQWNLRGPHLFQHDNATVNKASSMRCVPNRILMRIIPTARVHLKKKCISTQMMQFIFNLKKQSAECWTLNGCGFTYVLEMGRSFQVLRLAQICSEFKNGK